MKRTITILILVVTAGVGSLSLYRSIFPDELKVHAESVYARAEKSCYPTDYRSPSFLKKITLSMKEYTYALAIFKHFSNSEKLRSEIIYEKDLVKNSCKNYTMTSAPFSDILPWQIAVSFKKERWRRTLESLGARKFKELLNTPPEVSNPFYLYLEDVEALKLLGYEPGPKAKIIKSQRDLDYLYDQYEKPSKKQLNKPNPVNVE